jgi:hypothetical protein
VVLEELNPHLPFGNHLLGIFFLYWTRTRGFFYIFHCYIVDEGVQKSGLILI